MSGAPLGRGPSAPLTSRPVGHGVGGAVLVVFTLALGTAWLGGGARVPDATGTLPQEIERGVAGTVSDPDRTLVAAESTFTALRTVEPRLASSWVLPGLAAALAAVCLLRRLRGSPLGAGHGPVLRGGVSRRGPPRGSLA
jgi:hypothetical protein